eukprot:4197711-Prymnesium_polylepis.1
MSSASRGLKINFPTYSSTLDTCYHTAAAHRRGRGHPIVSIVFEIRESRLTEPKQCLCTAG